MQIHKAVRGYGSTVKHMCLSWGSINHWYPHPLNLNCNLLFQSALHDLSWAKPSSHINKKGPSSLTPCMRNGEWAQGRAATAGPVLRDTQCPKPAFVQLRDCSELFWKLSCPYFSIVTEIYPYFYTSAQQRSPSDPSALRNLFWAEIPKQPFPAEQG